MTWRDLLFYTVCVSVRVAIAFLVRITPRILTSILLMLVSIGFLVRFLTHDSSTKKGAFNGSVWWNGLRPFHSLTYLLSSFLVLAERQNVATWLLLGDVTVGLVAKLTTGASGGAKENETCQ